MPKISQKTSEEYDVAALQMAEKYKRKMLRDSMAEARRRNALENPRYEIFKRRYYYDWAGFAQHCIKWDISRNEIPADYQLEILAGYNSGCTFDWGQGMPVEEVLKLPISDFGHQTESRRSVRGPHGLGKTFIASIALLAFSLTTQGIVDWKIITTASRYFQLSTYFWPEVHKWAARIDWEKVGRPPLQVRKELFDMKIELTTHNEDGTQVSNIAKAASPARAEEMEGGHASRMFFIFDESKIIKDAFFYAAEGAFSTAGKDTQDEGYQLAVSTPGEPNGVFYKIHKRDPQFKMWDPIYISPETMIKQGRMSQEWFDEMHILWKNNPAQLANRVYGKFAAASENAIIPTAWIDEAIDNWYKWQEEAEKTGIKGRLTSVGGDVSEGLVGSDMNTIAPIYDGVKVDSLILTPNGEYDDAVIQMALQVIEVINMGGNDTAQAIIDAVGVGLGALHYVRHKGYWGRGFKSNFKTKMMDQNKILGFKDWRSASWWLTRELLDPKNEFGTCLPPDETDRLITELTAPKYKRNAASQIEVESKADIKKDIGVSTDYADAIMMGLIGGLLCDEQDMAKGRLEYGRTTV